MIEIVTKCSHGSVSRLKGILMRVIAGEISPNSALVCPECAKIIFYVEGVKR